MAEQNEMERRYFAYMAKREALRLRKERGAPWPWSDDDILNTYKFTNVKREHDRTTRWMRQYWTAPNKDRSAGEIIFNCALFRYFGTIEFAKAIGWQKQWDPTEIVAIARERMASRQRVFTGAYIIPTLGERRPKHEVVCERILSPLWTEKERLAKIAATTKSWKETAECLMTLPGFGGTGFMAKEVLQDVMHTRVLRETVDRDLWCPAGPGAQRGLNRIAGRDTKARINFEKSLSEMRRLFEMAVEFLPLHFPALELHDIQFQLCEFDKYERARNGEGRPKSIYRRRYQLIDDH